MNWKEKKDKCARLCKEFEVWYALVVECFPSYQTMQLELWYALFPVVDELKKLPAPEIAVKYYTGDDLYLFGKFFYVTYGSLMGCPKWKV